MESKEKNIYLALQWNNFFSQAEENLKNRFKIEVLDFYKDNLKVKGKRSKVKGKRNVKKIEAKEEMGLSKNTVNLPSTSESSNVDYSNVNGNVYSMKPKRKAAKRAIETTSLQLRQSCKEKLRNPGVSSDSLTSTISITSGKIKEKFVEEESANYDNKTNNEKDLKLPQCSVRLERCENLLNKQETENISMNDSTDVFKVPLLPLTKRKVAFSTVSYSSGQVTKLKLSASKSKQLLSTESSNFENHNELCSTEISLSDRDKIAPSENQSACDSNIEDSLLSYQSTASTDSQNKRPVRSKTRNKKYDDSTYLTNKLSFKPNISSALEKNEKSDENNELRGKKRKSDESNCRDSKVTKIENLDDPVKIVKNNIEDSANNKFLHVSSSQHSPLLEVGSVHNHQQSQKLVIDKSLEKNNPQKIKEQNHSSISLIDSSVKDTISSFGKSSSSKTGACSSSKKSDSPSGKAIPEVVVSQCGTSLVTSCQKTESNCVNETTESNHEVSSSTSSYQPSDKKEKEKKNEIEEPKEIFSRPKLAFDTPPQELRMTRTRSRDLNSKQLIMDQLGSKLGNGSKFNTGKENQNLKLFSLLDSGFKKTPQLNATPLTTNNTFTPNFKSHQKSNSCKKLVKPSGQSAIEKKNIIIKNTIEESKRKREEKHKKILLHKQAMIKKQEEKLARLNQEKIERDKAIAESKRLKEEQILLKKQQHEAMLKEAEERRLKEEEARLANLKRMEEEKRKIAEERQKQIEEAKKLNEKRLAEKAKEESLAEAAKLKKLKAAQNQAVLESYQLTPAKEDLPPLPAKSENDYGLSDENTDDSDDEVDHPKKVIPKWAAKNSRTLLGDCQELLHNDLVKSFFCLPSAWEQDMCGILNSTGLEHVINDRRSSGVWTTPTTK